MTSRGEFLGLFTLINFFLNLCAVYQMQPCTINTVTVCFFNLQTTSVGGKTFHFTRMLISYVCNCKSSKHLSGSKIGPAYGNFSIPNSCRWQMSSALWQPLISADHSMPQSSTTHPGPRPQTNGFLLIPTCCVFDTGPLFECTDVQLQLLSDRVRKPRECLHCWRGGRCWVGGWMLNPEESCTRKSINLLADTPNRTWSDTTARWKQMNVISYVVSLWKSQVTGGVNTILNYEINKSLLCEFRNAEWVDLCRAACIKYCLHQILGDFKIGSFQ